MAQRLHLTSEERRAVIDKNPFCVYCHLTNYDSLVLDHIYPVSLGGSNEWSNITVACGLCNSHKYNYPINEFLDTIIRKRKIANGYALKCIYNLRMLINGEPQHYQHSEKRLLQKIRSNKDLHSYYTRVINSIINNKYKIF